MSENAAMTPALRALMEMTEEDRAYVARLMSGEMDNWHIRVGDLIEAIRDLRTNPCPPSEYQRALTDVSRIAYRLSGPSA